MKTIASKSNGRGEVISPNEKCNRARKPCPYITVILFLILAALFCGCYSGKYEEEFNPCDPDVPVVLNGDTIPELEITRNDYGCVTAIDLSFIFISDPNCLSGIELWSANLEVLHLGVNSLSSIDLSPLSSCTNLERLIIYWNDLTSIDLTPLSSCSNLEVLSLCNNSLTNIDLSPLTSCTNFWLLDLSSNQLTSIDLSPIWTSYSLQHLFLYNNALDSASCAQVCDFIDEHPDCNVNTDCSCGKQRESSD